MQDVRQPGPAAHTRPPRGPGRRTALRAAAALAVIVASTGPAGTAPGAPLLERRLVVWGFADGTGLSQPRGVAFDPRDGAIYVANTGAHRIEVFSRTGRPLSKFVHRVSAADGTEIDGEPCALAVDRSGRLLVVDNAARYVDVLDRRWRRVARLMIPAGHPSALAVSSDSTIYVGTTGDTSEVHRFRADYTPAGSWGEQGETQGRLHGVTALAELTDSTIAVACARTDLGIQIFTREGVYLRGFGTHEMGPGNVSMPTGLLGTPDGRIWVLDEIRQNMQVFDRAGTFLEQIGGKEGDAVEFAYPSALAFDGRELVAVAEKGFGRFQVLAIPDRVESGAGKEK